MTAVSARCLITVFVAAALAASACAADSSSAPYDESQIVVGIGDSIMVAATDDLEAVVDGIVIDAEVGRPFRDAVPALNHYLSTGPEPDILVVALGTNAGASAEQIDDLMVATDGIDRVIFVNARVPRPWEAATNKAITDAADRYDNVEIVDWYGSSNDNGALFRDDGYHPNTTGSELWANLIAVEVKR